MPTAATTELVRLARDSLAGSALTGRQAKLYSQRLRRDMGREGLTSFDAGDVESYLDEAMLLLHCGLLERRQVPASNWRDGIKRAAEILEWLSQPSLKPVGAPLHLMAAAAYQLADYPAMALGHLRRVPDDQPFSTILRQLLRANFPETLEAIGGFWRVHRAVAEPPEIDPADLSALTVQHVVMAIGTTCAYLRTGEEGLVERALTKLDHLASSLLHSRDPYSGVLAQLTAGCCRRFVDACLWPRIEELSQVSTPAAGEALTQFARSAFLNGRALVWPAQAAGIDRLRANSSFVLCTPTGSGKTAVATLAVVQGLFAEPGAVANAAIGFGNLVLYLVPTRALAAEVEARLAQDLNGIASDPIVVTGLYGGIDWGPTDAWIQTDRATIVICTFEKADALVRFLGILFLNRVRLVVIDEAHMVEQDRTRLTGLEDGSSRSFRLEQLTSRLLQARNEYPFRVIALSAVAARAAPALGRWISDTPDTAPTTSSYRSTRQMVGRLEVTPAGQYSIRYDLMDGRSLRFDDEVAADTPYVNNPFPPLPNGIGADLGPEVRMRAPTLWAAIQLASQRADGTTPSVLISLTQHPEAFSTTCADLMDSWPDDMLPKYRVVDETNDLWVRCLASAADYFTVDSVEYRLLRRGIAVHHGKMPGLLARRLKSVIDRGIVRVVIATSTLSEGVNIPVSYLLIPSVCRGQNPFSLQEFTNLVGRAGRPGVSTEGSALVVLPERAMRRDRDGRRVPAFNRQWEGYEGLVAALEQTTEAAGDGAPEDGGSSPLAALLHALEVAWSGLTGGQNPDSFLLWLEETAVAGDDEIDTAHRYLDSLDTFLIAAIQEVEELRQTELLPDQVEAALTNIWRRTYAYAAAQEETRLAAIWLARGRAIKAKYPDATQRRRIYKSSLSPRSATRLMALAEEIRAALQTGAEYGHWNAEQRFEFVRDTLALLSQVPSFRIETTLGRSQNFQDWPKILRWWLSKVTLPRQPAPQDITKWYDFVAKNFIYRGAWGLGSIIGLLLDNTENGQPIRALEIEDWPRSGLPWIAFWIKELITWGTLDPVAAFLLARNDAVDRPQAEREALVYYDTLPADMNANDILDPRTVRDWAGRRRAAGNERRAVGDLEFECALVRPAGDYRMSRLVISPLSSNDELVWIDPAGYTVARSGRPAEWPDNPAAYEFELDVERGSIAGTAYLRHG